MKNLTKHLYRVSTLSLLVLFANCGLQLRPNVQESSAQEQPQVEHPSASAPTPVIEQHYTVGGQASGIPTDQKVVVSVNGVNHTIDKNGNFTLPEQYVSGDDYDVQVVSSVIKSCGKTYDCSIKNGMGSIIDHDVSDLVIKCVERCASH